MQGKSKYYFSPLFYAQAGFFITLPKENASGPSRAYPGHRLHIDSIDDKKTVVKAQESGATPTGGQRKKINIPLVSLAL